MFSTIVQAGYLNIMYITFRLQMINLLKPSNQSMHHHQFNIQQLYALPTLNLCVLYLSENKQRLVPLIAQTDFFYNRDEKCLQRGTDWVFI
jgi:hypothetical protein